MPYLARYRSNYIKSESEASSTALLQILHGPPSAYRQASPCHFSPELGWRDVHFKAGRQRYTDCSVFLSKVGYVMGVSWWADLPYVKQDRLDAPRRLASFEMRSLVCRQGE
jgi:hypothetical protein